MSVLIRRSLILCAVLISPTTADDHIPSTSSINTSHPWWIISTGTSRHPNKALYLTSAASNGEGALRVWDMDYGNPDKQMLFWIWPAEGEEEIFYLVGAKDSRSTLPAQRRPPTSLTSRHPPRRVETPPAAARRAEPG